MTSKPSAPGGERLTEEQMEEALRLANFGRNRVSPPKTTYSEANHLLSRALLQLEAECDADHPPEEAYLAWCEGADTDVVIALTRRLAERDALLRRVGEVLQTIGTPWSQRGDQVECIWCGGMAVDGRAIPHRTICPHVTIRALLSSISAQVDEVKG